MKIIIDPRNRYLYSSYYYQGIEELHPDSVCFSNRPFKELIKDKQAYDDYMALVIAENGRNHKVVIDFNDFNQIGEMPYAWCDVYAKINIANNKDISEYPKLLSITPGFGIKFESNIEIALKCVGNLLRCSFKPVCGINKFVRDYLYVCKLQPISFYTEAIESKDHYVYNISSLWPHPNCIKTTNRLRAAFMRSCIADKNVAFVGGFFCNAATGFEEYKDLIFTHRVKPKDYIVNTKKSAFVFNTPAVHNCHGWKLGEFLAMGKAIITTPLSNQLPSPLVDGNNFIEVNDENDMAKAIDMLVCDSSLRRTIEDNNRRYFDEFASPVAVMRQILSFLNIL